MWQLLRNRNFQGLKFYRQHVFKYEYNAQQKFFIADFYCYERKLVIEIDGGVHHQQKEYDQIRSEILETQHDLHVIRFSNAEILNDIESVLFKLSAATHP
jgi:very-short-patch-repair endonuclease